jgi:glycosyltransferase involved in cell wall biosynthesis
VVTFNDFVLVRLLGRWVRRRRPLSPENFVAGRILLVNNSLAPGGAERQLVNTAIGLADRGFEVSVLCNDLSSENGHDFYRPKLAGGMTVHELKRMWDYLSGENKDHNGAARASLVACGFEGRIPGLPVWVREDLLDYAAEFVTRRPQVVHLWQDYTNVIGGLAACYVGVPRIVLGMRNMAPFRFPYIQPFMRAAYKILADQPNVVLVNNSDAGAADYAAWLGIPRERLNVVRNGIDETHMQLPTPCEIRACRENLGLPADVFVVGSVFRFYPEKAPMLWVETAAAVARRRSDVVFLLVGWGPMQEKIMAHAAEAGITDRLYLPGPQDDVRSAISCMDVFLLNSRLEGSPNVLIEAQMMGVPVVTTIAGGSAETVEHGRTGWVVPGNNAEDLADRVLAILDDRPWAAQARAKASVHAGQRFGFARMIDDTLQAYSLGSDAGESRRFA